MMNAFTKTHTTPVHRDTMVMVVDQSEETTTGGKKKTKKGKKVKMSENGGVANGGPGADMGAMEGGTVIDDPGFLERLEVG